MKKSHSLRTVLLSICFHSVYSYIDKKTEQNCAIDDKESKQLLQQAYQLETVLVTTKKQHPQHKNTCTELIKQLNTHTYTYCKKSPVLFLLGPLEAIVPSTKNKQFTDQLVTIAQKHPLLLQQAKQPLSKDFSTLIRSIRKKLA